MLELLLIVLWPQVAGGMEDAVPDVWELVSASVLVQVQVSFPNWNSILHDLQLQDGQWQFQSLSRTIMKDQEIWLKALC